MGMGDWMVSEFIVDGRQNLLSTEGVARKYKRQAGKYCNIATHLRLLSSDSVTQVTNASVFAQKSHTSHTASNLMPNVASKSLGTITLDRPLIVACFNAGARGCA